MPNLKRPGTYIEEVLNPIASPQVASSSVAAFLGAHFRGPTTPVLLQSWSDFTTLFGGFPPAGTAPTDFPFAVYEYFANGGRACYAARIVGAGAARGTLTLVDRAGTPANTLRVDALNQGAWGNSLRISTVTRDAPNGRFDVLVYFGGTTDAFIVERFNDLSMASSDPRYAPSVINSPTAGSNYITVTDLGSATVAPNNMPAVITTVALGGGADGAAPDTTARTNAVSAGTSPLDQITGLLMVNMPGEVAAGVLGALITYAQNRPGTFVVVDPSPGLTAAGAVAEAATYSASSHVAYYWPRVVAQDPTGTSAQSVRTMPPGGFVLGKYAETDTVRGVFKTPAGLGVRLTGVFGLEAKPSNADLDALNVGHVNAIRQIPGAGVVLMGGRTLASNRADMYINVRRTLDYIEASLTESTRFALFENNDESLWTLVSSVASRFLGGLWSAGGLRGDTPAAAFYVKCDEETNPQVKIDSGILTYEVGVALQFPAEFIVIRIGQWEGGQSVAEAA